MSRCFFPGGQGKSCGKPPSLEEIRDFLGEPDSRPPGSYIKPEDAAKTAALDREREQFRRNAVILAVILASLTAVGLIAGSIIKNHADLPTTEGMSPLEVAATYYGAFGTKEPRSSASRMYVTRIRQPAVLPLTRPSSEFPTSKKRKISVFCRACPLA